MKHGDEGPTNVDGPAVRHHEESAELALPLDDRDTVDDEFPEDEATINRGSKPPPPSSSRLSPTLMKIFQRRREQIGLSIAQAARLSGIDKAELERFEGTNGVHRLVYDHAVILARVLGVKPSDMPGLRAKEAKDPVGEHVHELTTLLLAGPMLTFEGGRNGERYGGDLERVLTSPAFAITLGDSSLGEGWPKGAVLGFHGGDKASPGQVVLLRHRKSKLLGLRRLILPSYQGLAPWQPAYVVGAEWLPVGHLQVILPRP